MNMPPCPLCQTILTIDYDNSIEEYITSYCNHTTCQDTARDLCAYTAKFVNQKLSYDSFIIHDILMERYHQKNVTRLSKVAKISSQDSYPSRYEKSDPLIINKILPPEYDKLKLYLTLS